ncbi:hypothetical protein HMI51_27740 [Corallococcus coralloides]|nr:hypothetical protein [Corallococcus coralloides]
MSSSRTVKPPHPEVLFKTGSRSFELEQVLRRRGHGEQHFLALRRQPGREPVPVFLQALSLRGGGLSPSRDPRARLQETLSLSRLLEHPRIARLYGGHEVADLLFFEWERVPGCTLDDVAMLPLVYVHSYSEAFLVHVGLQLASLLGFLHGRTDARGAPLGFVHRDLHPQGIRFGPEGTLALTDLGDVLSRMPGRCPPASRVRTARCITARQRCCLGKGRMRARTSSHWGSSCWSWRRACISTACHARS